MNKQKTAIEWLEFEITKRGPHENNPPQWLIELYEQAKEMEKQQIIGSYLQGRMEGHNLPMSMDYVNLLDDAEGEALKYYKETYE